MFFIHIILVKQRQWIVSFNDRWLVQRVFWPAPHVYYCEKYTFFKNANCWLANRFRLLQEMFSSARLVLGLGIMNSSLVPLTKQLLRVSCCNR
jgi:hypothetical protein